MWSEKGKALKLKLTQALAAAGVPHVDCDYGNDVGPSVGFVVDGDDVWRAMVCGEDDREDGAPVIHVVVHSVESVADSRVTPPHAESFTIGKFDGFAEVVAFLLDPAVVDTIGKTIGAFTARAVLAGRNPIHVVARNMASTAKTTKTLTFLPAPVDNPGESQLADAVLDLIGTLDVGSRDLHADVETLLAELNALCRPLSSNLLRRRGSL